MARALAASAGLEYDTWNLSWNLALQSSGNAHVRERGVGSVGSRANKVVLERGFTVILARPRFMPIMYTSGASALAVCSHTV
jgi:hypothetical protein